MHRLAQLDHAYVWHPFTQMRDWLRSEPITIVFGKGAVLRDARGREFLDGNASIWTNLHGHNHPAINAAIRRQLKKIAHSSALGLANEPASLFAAELVKAAEATDAGRAIAGRKAKDTGPVLTKVFFSDDGSTALEVALKLAYEFTRRTRKRRAEPRFLSLGGAYHGDTIGAVALGHIDLFHKTWSRLLFKTDQIPAPYCYRCPFNQARPERRDAREYRKCHHECLELARRAFRKQAARGNPYAAFVFEPLIQGAAGMIAQPEGWLRQVTDMARRHGALLIADEVMTGFGRTGVGGASVPALAAPKRSEGWSRRMNAIVARTERKSTASSGASGGFPISDFRFHRLFACQHEGVRPDLLCLAKGMTGGYLPMAATLTTQPIFDAFLGRYDQFKTFFHGHSYTANQLGAAASLASLQLLQQPSNIRARARLQQTLREELQRLWALPHVGDIRQVGLIAGIELVRNWTTRERFPVRRRVGARVCEAMTHRGVITRPIGDVIVLMPPYCTTAGQVRKMVTALYEACEEVLG